ncbi:MAG: DUF5631 domain-containing protein [Mycolicibacterium sp.]|uniref:DUF5631 domain-containing protein n=1 Tax=Mycolicibacterium sp. TaxID=2320850 RepID=UPI003D0FE1A7
MGLFFRRGQRVRARAQAAALQQQSLPYWGRPDSGGDAGWGGPVTDCAAVVLDGVWPHELLHPQRPEIARIARYLHEDLLRIVERTNERLADLREQNLAPPHYRAVEARFLRVARSMAVLRVESSVRQVGGRSILAAPGMTELMRPPVPSPPREVERTAVLESVRDEPRRRPEPSPRVPVADSTTTHTRDAAAAEPDVAEPVETTASSVEGQESRVARHARWEVDERRAAVPAGEPDSWVARAAAAPVAAAEAVSPGRVDLRRVVGSLARQEPGVKWLAGRRGDGSVVVVTDVMWGWIPPGVVVPAGAVVLEPARRSGRMQEWVGALEDSVEYVPGNRIERDGLGGGGQEPFAVVEADADLGWHLGEATRLHEGLPRIVHTLARAGAGRTGVPEAEMDILRVHVQTGVRSLLGQYPSVSEQLALSCMLMGAAEAIASEQDVLAAYHYGWYEQIAGRRWE